MGRSGDQHRALERPLASERAVELVRSSSSATPVPRFDPSLATSRALLVVVEQVRFEIGDTVGELVPHYVVGHQAVRSEQFLCGRIGGVPEGFRSAVGVQIWMNFIYLIPKGGVDQGPRGLAGMEVALCEGGTCPDLSHCHCGADIV